MLKLSGQRAPAIPDCISRSDKAGGVYNNVKPGLSSSLSVWASCGQENKQNIQPKSHSSNPEWCEGPIIILFIRAYVRDTVIKRKYSGLMVDPPSQVADDDPCLCIVRRQKAKISPAVWPHSLIDRND